MYKLNSNQKRLPFGGHHFYEKDGHMFKGETFKEVADKLSGYRINNNIPVGDPEQEILRYYWMNFPWMVKDVLETRPVARNEDYDSWRGWVSRIWKSPPKKLVTRKEASIRWEACKECPFNIQKSWSETDESSELSRRAMLIRKGAEVPEYIGFCSLHGWDLSIATFADAPNSISDKKKDGANPDGCWV
jgi:hypothetical protein